MPNDGTSRMAEVVYHQATIELKTLDKVHPLNVEIAADMPAWQQGMMFRTEWEGLEGMLFVFNTEEPRNFWMKNTHLPLDIVFFDRGGRIANIVEGAVPFSETHIPSLIPAQYVLELPAGKVAELMINDATVLDVESINRPKL